MIKKVIAVYDKKTALYDAPFSVRHIGEAIREWETITKDPKTKFGKNPEDFDLFQISEYDDTTGQFQNTIPPLHLGSGIQ